METISITVIEYTNTSGYLFQKWKIKCSDKSGSSKTQNFIKSTETNSPTGNSISSNFRSVLVLCITRQGLTILERMFFVVFNERINFKLVTIHSNLSDCLLEMMKQWDGLQFNSH